MDDSHESASPTGRPPPESAEVWFAQETFRPATPTRDGPRPEAYSLAWFEDAESRRFGRHATWLPKLLEYTRHPDETVLGLGDGIGTDWVQFARHRANVIACAPAADRLSAIRRNFESRGLPAQFVLAPPERLPFADACVDVVHLNGLHTAWADPAAVAAEIYRVLRPGGKIIGMVPGYYSASFWSSVFFPWQRWTAGRAETPPCTWTARQLKRLFVSFVEHRVHKRQLRRSELPHIWRLLPLSVLERIMGRVLIVKAFKPLSAALPLRTAA